MSVQSHWLYDMSDFLRGQLFVGNVKKIQCPWCDDSGLVYRATQNYKEGEYALLQLFPCACRVSQSTIRFFAAISIPPMNNVIIAIGETDPIPEPTLNGNET